ncbi:MAG: hypothetical protein WDN23_08925 [Edaphobacter sp.]
MDCKKDDWYLEFFFLYGCRPSQISNSSDAPPPPELASCLNQRYQAWETHVDTFIRVKLTEPQPGKSEELMPSEQQKEGCLFWHEHRIKFLIDHLDILDRKIGMNLQFQALLATAIGILLARADSAICQNPYFYGPAIVLSLTWFGATMLCLLGVYRLEWGDLGAKVDSTQQAISDAGIDAAEKDYVKTLICEVIRRTAKFRVAICLTISSVVIFFVMCFTVSYRLVHPDRPAPSSGAGHSLFH